MTTDYWLNGSSILRQKTGNDILDFFYDESGNVYGLNYNGTDYYYIRNGQNDIIGILDAAGTQIVKYSYDNPL